MALIQKDKPVGIDIPIGRLQVSLVQRLLRHWERRQRLKQSLKYRPLPALKRMKHVGYLFLTTPFLTQRWSIK